MLNALSPAMAGSGVPLLLTVIGSGFTPASVIQIAGVAHTTQFVSAEQLTTTLTATDLAVAGIVPVDVFTPGSTGGTSATLPFTIVPASTTGTTQTFTAVDVTMSATIIAKVTAPTGGGSRNIEVIRDGDMPPVGSTDSSRQYDTFTDKDGAATDDWIGYEYAAPKVFSKLLFQEGKNFPDGGWFNKLNVQVRQNGVWTTVPTSVSTPAYPPNDGINFETYALDFSPTAGDAIRIQGVPGGSESFISVGELRAYALQPTPLTEITHTGTIVAKIMNPTGDGSRNLEVIRDGDMPPVGSTDSRRQYDTFTGTLRDDDWIGYQYTTPQNFGRVVFQEGNNFLDGGWFDTLQVEVLQNGVWVPVNHLIATPAYPPNDNINFETYVLDFDSIQGDGIRIDGKPGGTHTFISVGELKVYTR